MNDLPGEFELFQFETSLRKLISELITPICNRTMVHENQLKDLTQANGRNQENIQNFEATFEKTIGKMHLVSDFNKSFGELSTSTKSSDTEIRHKFEGLSSRVDHMNHQFSDMLSRIKLLEDGQKTLKLYFEDQGKAVREFKEIVSGKLTDMQVSIMSSSQSNLDLIENFNEQVRMNSTCLNEINQKALPEIGLDIALQNSFIQELKSQIQTLTDIRVLPDDLVKLSNKLDYNVKKTYKKNRNEIKNIKSFLDKMLKIEISCGVSETLLQILDTRQIKKLIPVVEGQLSDFTNAEVLESTSSPHRSLLHQNTLKRNREIEEKIFLAKEKISQDEKSPLKVPQIPVIRSSRESPIRPISEVSKEIILEKSETETQRIETNAVTIPPNENPVKTERIYPQMREETLRTEKSQEILDKISDISFDPVLFQEQLQDLTLEVAILKSYKEESLNNINKCTQSLTLKVEEVHKQFTRNVYALDQEYQQLSKQRIKDLSEIRSHLNSSINEISDKVASVSGFDEQADKLAELIQSSIKTSKILYKLIAQDEIDRKTIQLSAYSENKQSCKSVIRPKLSVSLKPECMSCTGQGPLVYSAFKMACLNYAPSEIMYEGKNYTRQVLIEKLGEVLEENQKKIMGSEKIQPIFINDESVIQLKAKTRHTSRYVLGNSTSRFNFEPETPIRSRRNIKSMHK